MELAIGNFVSFTATATTSHRFQNFFINEIVQRPEGIYTFLPFGFSGVTVNRTGDSTEASLVFPNNQLSRAWAVDAIENRWLARVQVMILDPDDRTQFTQLHQYFGKAASGEWNETSVTLRLNTVLDAVGTDAPFRRLTQRLIGAIPVTSGVRLQ
jgi:hypothetical protein